jgi:hypothetical protein
MKKRKYPLGYPPEICDLVLEAHESGRSAEWIANAVRYSFRKRIRPITIAAILRRDGKIDGGAAGDPTPAMIEEAKRQIWKERETAEFDRGTRERYPRLRTLVSGHR